MNRIVDSARRAVLALLGSQERLSYRRLLVFATATCLLLAQRLDAQTWLYVALAYLGVDAAEKMLRAATGGRALPSTGDGG